MIAEQIRIGTMGNFSYVFADQEGGEGMVVDPAHDVEVILEVLKKHRINLSRIVITHHHLDHLNVAMPLKARTGATIWAHEETARMAAGNVVLDGKLADGDEFKIGQEVVHVLHTPGHAPGSICLVIASQWLVTGDTLFIGNCGRTNLTGGNAKTLFKSLQRLKELPDSLMVFPGHDYGPAHFRTLGEEKKKNPTLIAPNFREFEAVP